MNDDRNDPSSLWNFSNQRWGRGSSQENEFADDSARRASVEMYGQYYGAHEKMKEVCPEGLKAIYESMSSTGAPFPLILGAMIGALSVAASGRGDIVTSGGRKIPLSVQVLGIGPSGIGKTPAYNWFFSGLSKLEADWVKEFPIATCSYKGRIGVIDIEIAGLSRKLHRALKDGSDDSKVKSDLEKAIANKPLPPTLRRINAKNATWPAMAKLVGQAPVICVGASEGETVISAPTLRNLGNYCALWDGEFSGLDRSEGSVVPAADPRVVIVLFMQPEIFEQFSTDPRLNARAIGFMARCLIFSAEYDASRSQKNRGSGDRAETNKILARMNKLITESWEIREAGGSRLAMSLTRDAEDRWEKIEKEFKEKAQTGGRLESVWEYAAKAPFNVLRIAGLMSLVFREESPIDVGFIEFAYEVVKGSTEEYLSIYSPEACQKRLGEKLAAYLEEQDGRGRRIIAKNYVLKHGAECLRKVDPLDDAIQYLKRLGRVSVEKKANTYFLVYEPARGNRHNDIWWSEEMMRAQKIR